MFTKVLIANRGAIAVRIERTLRKMGIASVAVYTKADQDSLHVDMADEAVLIGDGPAKESYLNAELILQTAIDTGAEAIHPAYGFLSENPEFARACGVRGITFIGPSPEQMEVFGLKHAAREVAERTGVPMLHGTPLITSLEEATSAADAIGYPVILKSTAGGGGIGMRVCNDAEQLQDSYEAVRHLAEINFKNGGLFLEKYIAKARHVEVQLFGNEFGEVVALGERDCSIQRRNQKVIEESPAPNFPDRVRQEMLAAARRLASEVGYRSAGTVEFLYDPDAERFYFLEVNTRLQVEHGVTEEVLGIDLVEWMLKEAAGELRNLKDLVPKVHGHSIQARIYAEDCLQDFRPSAGQLDQVQFAPEARIETWVRDGLTVTSMYDPMLAKIIVHGNSRAEAIHRLVAALEQTRMYGVTTNLAYLAALLQQADFQDGNVYTRLLSGFAPAEHALEVIDGGVQTTVQDFPGRVGYWAVGVPPCGPMDSLAFRIGNHLLGNDERASGLELTLRGGSYRFRDDLWFCVTGADMQATLDNAVIPMYQPVFARRDQVLTFAETQVGMRTYLTVAGGFDMPTILGSASTFTLGGFGGQGGRALRTGDVLRVKLAQHQNLIVAGAVEPAERPTLSNNWTIGVIPGPHCTSEFLSDDYLEQLTQTTWEIHFNSSRTGVRLIGPTPPWTREDGGEAGLHPSNIHDNPYAIGALDLTGDMPIFLGPDGPSLGGFVCPVTTAKAELWKIGQLRPGDTVQFRLMALEEADWLRRTQEQKLQAMSQRNMIVAMDAGAFMETTRVQANDAVLARRIDDRRFPITVRAAGDENLLVEYGPMELDLSLRFQVHALMQAVEQADTIPVIDLTPGIRSLQVHIDSSQISVREACQRLLDIEANLPPLESIRVPSRIVRLPLSWDDPATQLAIDRYQQGVRPDAPWCPSNLEFIRRINGLADIDAVKAVVFGATYLVLGLGDVYLGAPVATPLDPRHRLVTTKYNPARTWTPENAVGIGGAYLCVYGMEGPGGYQFVGRTIQMWNRLRSTQSFQSGKPWLLRFFDQIEFYPVPANELLTLREDFLRGRFEADITETTFDLGEYLQFLDGIGDSITAFRTVQQQAFQAERDRWKALGLDEYVADNAGNAEASSEEVLDGTDPIHCNMPGSIWKVLVEPGQRVEKRDPLIIVESMKMEFVQQAPCDGVIGQVFVNPGDSVHAGQLIVGILSAETVEVEQV